MRITTHVRTVLQTGVLALIVTNLAADCGTEPKASTIALDLTTSGAGQGTLSIAPDANDTVGTSFYFPQGATVTITANSATGSVFTGWGRASASNGAPGGCTAPANPCAVTLNEHKSVVGRFTLSAGVRRFDGEYTGTITKNGNAGTGPLELRITNGAVEGWLTPSSTAGTFTGSVNDAGTFSAVVQGVGGACSATLAGQFTTSSSAGITTAEASGTFTYPQGQSCGQPNSTWMVTRDRIPITKTVAPVQ